MDYRSKLLDLFDSYCEASGLAPATVSTMVMNHGGFYDRLKSGGGITMRTYEHATNWFKTNKPKKKR